MIEYKEAAHLCIQGRSNKFIVPAGEHQTHSLLMDIIHNSGKMEIKKVSLEALSSITTNGSLDVPDGRVLYVVDYDDTENAEKLLSMANKLYPANESVLILQRKKGMRGKAHNALCSGVEQVSEFSVAQYDIQNWATETLKQEGFDGTLESMDELAYRLGSDFYRLPLEMYKIGLLRKDKKFTIADVNSIVFDRSGSNIFAVSQELVLGNAQRVLRSLPQIQETSYVPFIRAIASEAYRFYMVKVLLSKDSKVTPEEVAVSLNLHPFLLRSKYQSRVRPVKIQRLVRILELASEAESKIISSSQVHRQYLFNSIVVGILNC